MSTSIDFNNLWKRIDYIFQGRYEYRGNLGSGGMGFVFLVQANDLGARFYALKIIDKQSPENSGVDVYAEIQMLKSLRHPGVVSIFEALEDERYVFIVQDYINGKTLAQIRDDASVQSAVSEETVRLWMLDVADAMAYIHSMNIVHRDIKPGNIMIDSDGNARIIDFGIARRISTINKTSTGNTIGSAPYSPLERLEGYADNIQTDIYAYGTTFYSLLRRKIPSVSGREINTLRTSNRSVKPYYMNAYRTMMGDLEYIRDDGLRELIRGCIDIEPARRIRDFNTIRYRLRSIDQVRQVHVEKKSEYRRTRVILCAMLIAGVLLAGMGIVQMKRDHDHRFDRIIESADAAYDAGDYSSSMDEAERAIRFDPDNTAGYITKYKAQTAYAYERNDQSAYMDIISGINKDITELPSLEDDLYAVTYLANAYFETGETDKTIGVLSGRSDLEDDQLMLLGHAFYLNGENARAMECLEKIKKDVPQKFYLEGLTTQDRDPDKAVSCYRQVLDADGGAAGINDLKRKALSQIAQIYIDKGEYSQAISVITEETGRNALLKDSMKINHMLLDCYYQNGNYSEAVSQADIMINDLSDHSAYSIKLRSQLRLGRYNDALSTVDSWEKADSEDPELHILKAMTYNYIAHAASSDAEIRRTYEDFVRVYEEEERWLTQHDAVNAEFLSLEEPYHEALEALY